MDFINYFVSGAVAGAAGTLVSHPFFTLKTCLQNGEKLIFRTSFVKNLKWLYGGFGYAIVGYSIEKTLVFGSYMSIMHLLKKNHYTQNRLQKYHSFVAGFLAGVATSNHKT